MHAKREPFDRDLLAQRRKLSLIRKVKGADFLLKIATEELQDRLAAVNKKFDKALDLTGHTDHVSRMLKKSGKVNEIVRADPQVPDVSAGTPSLVYNEECLPFAPASFDLIISALTMHWSNDLPGSLVQIRRSLKPDGLFLGILPGTDTLMELRQAFLLAESELSGGSSPRIDPFPDTLALGRLLQRAGFTLTVVDKDNFIVRYSDSFQLMNELKSMGVTSVLKDRSRKPATKTLLNKVAEIYQQRFSDKDGRIRATIQQISLSGWAPHSSQQQPLAPGSAEISLAKILPLTMKENQN